MTRRFVFVALLAIALAVPALVMAQTPNFTGKWVQDMDKSDPAPAGRGGGGGGGGRGPAGPQTLTYTQTAADLTIEREGANGVIKTVYKLDGSESANTMGQAEVKSKTTWDGNKLVTKYQQAGRGGGEPTEVVEVREMNADGTMSVTTTRGTNPPRKLVFKKG
jgi:hypothetical protein